MTLPCIAVAGLLTGLIVLGLGLILGGRRLRHLAALVRWSRARSPSNRPGDDILRFYALGLEEGRLDEDYFPLERARTRELVLRHLPPPPGVIVDVGGGAGSYSFWLAEKGYDVHLVDLSPLHVKQAGDMSTRTGRRLASVRVGDARKLDFGDSAAAAVLLLGPLYHLTTAEDRLAALREARRVLRPGGWLFAAGISRFASLVDGLRGTVFEDDAFAEIVARDLKDGQHRNDTDKPHYFTTAFFHHPDELAREVREAGFGLEGLYGIEGPGAFIPAFADRWKDPKSRDRLLGLLREVESEPTLLGVSPHLLAVGRT